jgi:acetyl-CoA acetyltransferase
VAIAADEGIRPGSSVETLAKLKPSFTPEGLITAGNSSQISDGATLLSELERTEGRFGLQAMCEGGGMANVITIIERLG